MFQQVPDRRDRAQLVRHLVTVVIRSSETTLKCSAVRRAQAVALAACWQISGDRSARPRSRWGTPPARGVGAGSRILDNGSRRRNRVLGARPPAGRRPGPARSPRSRAPTPVRRPRTLGAPERNRFPRSGAMQRARNPRRCACCATPGRQRRSPTEERMPVRTLKQAINKIAQRTVEFAETVRGRRRRRSPRARRRSDFAW